MHLAIDVPMGQSAEDSQRESERLVGIVIAQSDAPGAAGAAAAAAPPAQYSVQTAPNTSLLHPPPAPAPAAAHPYVVLPRPPAPRAPPAAGPWAGMRCSLEVLGVAAPPPAAEEEADAHDARTPDFYECCLGDDDQLHIFLPAVHGGGGWTPVLPRPALSPMHRANAANFTNARDARAYLLINEECAVLTGIYAERRHVLSESLLDDLQDRITDVGDALLRLRARVAARRQAWEPEPAVDYFISLPAGVEGSPFIAEFVESFRLGRPDAPREPWHEAEPHADVDAFVVCPQCTAHNHPEIYSCEVCDMQLREPPLDEDAR